MPSRSARGDDEGEFEGQRPIELVDHAGAVARGDHRESSYGDPVASLSLAHSVEPHVELVDNRHELRQFLSGTRPKTTTEFSSAATKRRTRKSGSSSTYWRSAVTPVSPICLASQRRKDSTDHTLPTPGWLSTTLWTSAIVASVCGV